MRDLCHLVLTEALLTEQSSAKKEELRARLDPRSQQEAMRIVDDACSKEAGWGWLRRLALARKVGIVVFEVGFEVGFLVGFLHLRLAF